MPLIDELKASYLSLSRIMRALDDSKVDVGQLASDAIGLRDRLDLNGGYNVLSPALGLCLPEDAMGEVGALEPQGVRIATGRAAWMTVESTVTARRESFTAVIEMEIGGQHSVHVDIFVRDFVAEDAYEDRPAEQFAVFPGQQASILIDYARPAPEGGNAAPDLFARRLIFQFRSPPEEIALASMRLYIL